MALLFVKMGVPINFLALMIDIREIIISLQKRKADMNIEPTIVPLVDIQREAYKQIVDELRTLTKDKQINYHKTLKSVAFSVDYE